MTITNANCSVMTPNMQERIDMAQEHFDRLYGNVTDSKFGYLWAKQGATKATYSFDVSTPDNRRQMAIKAIELNDAGFDVYYGVNLVDSPLAENQRATNATVSVQTATVTDIDIEGGLHVNTDKKFYPPDFDTAKYFLPFASSLNVDSGYGLHGLNIYSEPIPITDDNRAEAKARNEKYISLIKSHAGKYGKAVDGVGDLARVLRVPGTRNYKLGISEDAPLCHVVEANAVRFTPADFDGRLNALMPDKQPDTKPARKTQKKFQSTAADLGNDYDLWRAEKMLEVLSTINHKDLEYNQWLAIQSACKAIGVPYAVVDAFNQCEPTNYNAEENARRWEGLDIAGYGIETLHGIAKQFGYSEKDARREWYKLHPESKPADRADLSGSETRKQMNDDEREEPADLYAAIRNQCKWSRDKNGYPTKIKSDVYNYKIVFEQDPNLRGLFGRDDFRQETIFLKRATWHNKNLPLKDTWDDSDDAELRLYLAEHYAEMGTPQRTLDFVIRTARENSFHAIRNFFEGLPKWDGVERAETIFIKFLGAEDTRYTREITMHFLFGAIARAFYPGCDFQSVVVLQGPQGIGKSRVLRMLGGKHGVNPKGDSWHIALRDQLDDSHAVDAMRKGWVIEIEEFAACSRADVNSMKGVLSSDDVTRRFAYERHAKTIKAHWVFAATCNDDAPLRDQTGNRRFLPIKCNNKESTIVEGMTPEYIRLVWAEAYHKFLELFPTVEAFDADKLRLPPDLQAQAAKIAEGITQDDGLATEIKGFLERKIPPLAIWYLLTKEERRKFFTEGSITLLDCVADLNKRARAKYGRNAQSYIDDLDRIFNSNDIVIRKVTIKRGDDSLDEYHIYGTEERQHICAAEIFNECFGQDNRKRMPRINETLALLEGWKAGERLQKIDPAYPDQKKPYYRS